jgi:NDP-sugar pyrophosphorylase family protein
VSYEFNNQQESKENNPLNDTTVVINAGGRGTRLNDIFDADPEIGITKAMLEFNSKPIVQHHVDLILELGFKNVIVAAGDHKNVSDYFAQQPPNEKLQVINTEVQHGTGGDLLKAIKESGDYVGKYVLAENVDTLIAIKNMVDLINFHKEKNATGTIVLTTKKGVPNENAFYLDEQSKVIFSKEADIKHGLVEPENWQGLKASSTGIVIFSTDFLINHQWQPKDGDLSIYRDIIPELIKSGQFYGYNNENNLFIDIGTPENYIPVKKHEHKLFGAIKDRYNQK